MNTAEYLPSNNLFILISVLLIAVAALLFFLRKRSNRHPMDTPRGHQIDEQHRREALDARGPIDVPPTRR
jgi:LPXTG-motif cell wall-anchored protein